MHTQWTSRSNTGRLLAWGSRSRLTPIVLATIAFAACSEPPTAPPTVPPSAMMPLANEVQQQATTWTKQILPAYPGKTGARANDISDSGTVVGESMTLPYGTDERPVYWKQSKVNPLSMGGATTGFATAISDNDIFVVGYTKRFTGYATIQQAVIWTLTIANPPPFALLTCGLTGDPIATGVNNKGVIVGQIGLKAVSWANKSSCPTPIVVAGKTMTIARGINDVNSIVGLGHLNTWSPRGFVYGGRTHGALPALSGHLWTDAHAVNDANVIVGRSWALGSQYSTAVYWGSSGVVALGSMSHGGRVAISDKGRFVWGTTYSTGRTKYGSSTYTFSAIPLGVNVCGDMVGLANGQAVRYKKTVCD